MTSRMTSLAGQVLRDGPRLEDLYNLWVSPWSNEAEARRRKGRLCRPSHNQRNVLSLPCYKITGSLRWGSPPGNRATAYLFSYLSSLRYLALPSSWWCTTEILEHSILHSSLVQFSYFIPRCLLLAISSREWPCQSALCPYILPYHTFNTLIFIYLCHTL